MGARLPIDTGGQHLLDFARDLAFENLQVADEVVATGLTLQDALLLQRAHRLLEEERCRPLVGPAKHELTKPIDAGRVADEVCQQLLSAKRLERLQRQDVAVAAFRLGLIATAEDQQHRSVLHPVDQIPHERRRILVEPLAVFDDQHRSRRPGRHQQQLAHRFADCAALLQGIALQPSPGSPRQGQTEQRGRGIQKVRSRGQTGLELRLYRRRRITRQDAELRAYEIGDGQVDGIAIVGFGAGLEHRGVLAHAMQKLVDQPRLADTWPAGDRDDLSLACLGASKRPAEQIQLRFAADELTQALVLSRVETGPCLDAFELEHLDRVFHAVDHPSPERDGADEAPCEEPRGLGQEDLARRRQCLHSLGENRRFTRQPGHQAVARHHLPRAQADPHIAFSADRIAAALRSNGGSRPEATGRRGMRAPHDLPEPEAPQRQP